jgi:uncharacterized protein (TIGR00156 family)
VCLRICKNLLCLSAFALISPWAHAQYVGPSTMPTYRSVADVLKNPVDDVPVVLEGYIIKQVGKEKHIFSDGTAEIRIDIDQKHFPATPINEKMKVQIRGEVEKDYLQSPEIDVEGLTIIN